MNQQRTEQMIELAKNLEDRFDQKDLTMWQTKRPRATPQAPYTQCGKRNVPVPH
jgi:hypothetical protein